MKYQSPSSPDVKHDKFNLLVEFIMINKYGYIDAYSWRKGNPLHKEWGQVCKIIKRLVQTLKIDASRLGWYIKNHNVTKLDYKEFGLVRWKINKWFPFGNLEKTSEFYKKQLENKLLDLESDEAISNIKEYKTKKSFEIKQNKTLLDVISELEANYNA